MGEFIGQLLFVAIVSGSVSGLCYELGKARGRNESVNFEGCFMEASIYLDSTFVGKKILKSPVEVDK